MSVCVHILTMFKLLYQANNRYAPKGQLDQNKEFILTTKWPLVIEKFLNVLKLRKTLLQYFI